MFQPSQCYYIFEIQLYLEFWKDNNSIYCGMTQQNTIGKNLKSNFWHIKEKINILHFIIEA